MITARIKADNVIKMLKNSVEYSSAFTTELNKNKAILNQKLGEESIDAFYNYLDGLARSHPGMLHHVYEWGEVGDPAARLYELGLSVNNTSAVINTTFLFSDQPASESGHIFEDKARVMEYGESVTVNEIDAEALFFKIDGEEFFRKGPIFISNPGGIQVRGSFVRAFDEFYNSYFTEVHLRSIKFYKHFSNPKVYEKYFSSAVKSGGANSKGKKAALSWIMNAPGGNYGNL